MCTGCSFRDRRSHFWVRIKRVSLGSSLTGRRTVVVQKFANLVKQDVLVSHTTSGTSGTPVKYERSETKETYDVLFLFSNTAY